MQMPSVADAIPRVEWDGVALETGYGDLALGLFFRVLLIHHGEKHDTFLPETQVTAQLSSVLRSSLSSNPSRWSITKACDELHPFSIFQGDS